MTVTSTCAGAADTVFVRDGQTVIAEYAASTAAASTLRKYVNASYVDEPVLLIDRTAAGSVGAGTDERFYYHRNQQYSITALTDNSGTPVERYAYTAYGEPTILDGAGTTTRTASFIANPYLYTARAYDAESGLYYFRARMYEVRKGRFLSHDPIMYPDGYNTYAGWFAVSDTDPMGTHCWEDCFHWYDMQANRCRMKRDACKAMAGMRGGIGGWRDRRMCDFYYASCMAGVDAGYVICLTTSEQTLRAVTVAVLVTVVIVDQTGIARTVAVVTLVVMYEDSNGNRVFRTGRCGT